jgi:hypothetical protein
MKTRTDYEATLEIVRSVIAEWDPYSLLRGGAPKDEFDGEIAKIVTRVGNMHNPNDAAAAIADVFSSSFDGKAFDLVACAQVGAKLYRRLAQAGIVEHDA